MENNLCTIIILLLYQCQIHTLQTRRLILSYNECNILSNDWLIVLDVLVVEILIVKMNRTAREEIKDILMNQTEL